MFAAPRDDRGVYVGLLTLRKTGFYVMGAASLVGRRRLLWTISDDGSRSGRG
jgi:hypothetical protein